MECYIVFIWWTGLYRPRCHLKDFKKPSHHCFGLYHSQVRVSYPPKTSSIKGGPTFVVVGKIYKHWYIQQKIRVRSGMVETLLMRSCILTKPDLSIMCGGQYSCFLFLQVEVVEVKRQWLLLYCGCRNDHFHEKVLHFCCALVHLYTMSSLRAWVYRKPLFSINYPKGGG